MVSSKGLVVVGEQAAVEVVVATRTSVSAKRDSRLALTQGPTSHLRPARAGLQRRHLLRILMP